jgi:hypothetical protein
MSSLQGFLQGMESGNDICFLVDGKKSWIDA